MAVVQAGSCSSVQPLAWELPYAAVAALKKKQKQKQKQKRQEKNSCISFFTFNTQYFILFDAIVILFDFIFRLFVDNNDPWTTQVLGAPLFRKTSVHNF